MPQRAPLIRSASATRVGFAARLGSFFKAARLLFPAYGGAFGTNSAYGGGAYGGLFGGFFSRLKNGFDYRGEAGVLWESRVVYACLRWLINAAPQAKPHVVRPDAQGKLVPLPGHPLAKLLKRPNPDYDWAVLLAGIIISFFAGEDGQAYLYKTRDNLGRVNALYFVPDFMIEPQWPPDGSEFISHYLYSVDGKNIRWEKDDVIVIRNGIDPNQTRKGLRPLYSVLRDINVDNEAASFTASLLRNSGVPGLFIMPYPSGGDPDNWDSFNDSEGRKLKDLSVETWGKENRGQSFVFSRPIKAEQFAFNPQQMIMTEQRAMAAESIAAVIGVALELLGLTLGRNSSTYNNVSEARERTWQDTLQPFLTRVAASLTEAFAEERGFALGEMDEVEFNYDKVQALIPDINLIHERARKNFESGLLSQNESRSEIKYPPLPEGDQFIWQFETPAEALLPPKPPQAVGDVVNEPEPNAA